jgi:hypothetical protein
MKTTALAASLLIGLAVFSGPSGVPPKYAAAYELYKTGLERYDAYLDGAGPGRGRPVLFGAELLAANSNQGPALLTPQAERVSALTLDRFKEMGLQGATLAIGYPILTDDVERSADYLAFYKKIAGLVRERGLKLCVKLHVVFVKTDFARLDADFSGLTIEKLARGKRLMAERILRDMAPDYLTLGGEPDTEAKLTGLPRLGTPEGYAELAAAILKGLPRGKTLVGVGQGTWISPDFAEAFAKLDVDFINLHVYAFGRQTLANADRVCDIAARAGKRLILDECWLYKALPGESGPIAATADVFRRDWYTFWTPLDKLFLRTMAKLASRRGIEYVSPFWSGCFFAGLEYRDELDKGSYLAGQQEFNREVFKNLQAGALTDLGRFFSGLVKRP